MWTSSGRVARPAGVGERWPFSVACEKIPGGVFVGVEMAKVLLVGQRRFKGFGYLDCSSVVQEACQMVIFSPGRRGGGGLGRLG